MVIRGNPKRFIIGVWVLTALLVFWFNAAALTSLLDKPLTGMSPEARTTIAKWQRLENSLALKLEQVMDPREIEKIVARIDFKKRKTVLPAKKARPMPTPAKKTEPAPKKPVKLPALSGIVAVYGTDGAVVHLAVIDGKAREENSRIGDFYLEKIDAKGILLARDKKNWFIPAPTVAFSMDTSMEE